MLRMVAFQAGSGDTWRYYASLFTSVQLDQADKISELEPQNYHSEILKVRHCFLAIFQ